MQIVSNFWSSKRSRKPFFSTARRPFTFQETRL